MLTFLSKGRACFQSGVPTRLEQESVKEGDGKRDGFGRDCRVVFDEIADGGKASDSCPLGVSRKGGKRAAAVGFQIHHYGSGHGVQGDHPPELALAHNSLALLGLAQYQFADDAPALLGGHG